MARNVIKIFCLSCDNYRQLHEAVALDENGKIIAQHICSDHGWIENDMGIVGDNKHDLYRQIYPDGFVVKWGNKEELLKMILLKIQ